MKVLPTNAKGGDCQCIWCWQLFLATFLCLKANISDCILLKCVYYYLAQIPEQSHEDLQGVRQGVPEDASAGVPDVQVYQRF